jgi:diguanylate cyclase (GGDEF)-like protein/PAS domain S-box-containing protein
MQPMTRKRERFALAIAGLCCMAVPVKYGTQLVMHQPNVLPGWLVLFFSVAGLAAFSIFFWLDRNLRRLVQRLSVKQDRLTLCLWASGASYWDWDLVTNQIHRSGTKDVFGEDYSGNIDAKRWREQTVHPDDLATVDLRMRRHLNGETTEFLSEHRMRKADGQFFWMRSRGKIVERDADGNPLRMAGISTDINTSREREQELIIAQEALHSISEGVLVLSDNGCVRTVNPAFERMSGFAANDLTGVSWQMLGSPRLDPSLLENLLKRSQTFGAWSGELWLKRKTGEDIYVNAEISLIPEHNGSNASFVVVMNDLTEKKRAEIEVKHLTNFDPLTGLPNRMMFMNRLGRSLQSNQRSERITGLAFVNVDRFMQVNESLGHGGGDELLRCLALRIANNVREMDSVARFGGLQSSEEGMEICRRISKALGESMQVMATEVAITASIGLAVSPEHADQPDSLLRASVGAMQVVKALGGNDVHLSTGNDEVAARERIGMETALRRALERDEFSVVFQPVFCLSKRKTVRLEALLRWNNKQFGNVPPDRFIPILEQTGLIAPVGEWVLSESLMRLQALRWEGFDLKMAVNISPLQLSRGDLPSFIQMLLQRLELPGELLELELTESVVMADPEHSIELLKRLRTLGITIAIDDFGTGYSSLSYLRRLPIQKLKIDKAFVRDLDVDGDDAAIIDTVLAMAKALKLRTVAEGVETKAQLEYLAAQECDEIQGFFIAKPLSVDALQLHLSKENQLAH